MTITAIILANLVLSVLVIAAVYSIAWFVGVAGERRSAAITRPGFERREDERLAA